MATTVTTKGNDDSNPRYATVQEFCALNQSSESDSEGDDNNGRHFRFPHRLCLQLLGLPLPACSADKKRQTDR